MIFEDTKCKGKYAVLLPGPPKEMQPMFCDTVRPWLAKMSDGVLFSRTLRVTGVGESHLEPKISDLLETANPTSALYAKMGEVVIRVTAKAATLEKAQEMCAQRAQELKERLGDVVYTDAFDSLEETVVDTLKRTKKTVATAESCTGGLLSQRLTAVAGASEVFSFGTCTYSNEMKQQILGVPAQMLADVGAVSPQVAAAMARGVRACSGAEIGVGITGIAGPGGGTPEKPVGLVYVSVCDARATYVQKLLMTNRTRDSVRTWASQHALEMVRRLALGLEQPGCDCFENGQAVEMSDHEGLRNV